jgi:hypothetical protein
MAMILGVLSCLDGYMNIALEQTEEHVNGVVTNRYGDAFVRGNNGTSVSFALIRALFPVDWIARVEACDLFRLQLPIYASLSLCQSLTRG